MKEPSAPRIMRRVRKGVLLVAAVLALLAAGGASAYIVARTIWLKPGLISLASPLDNLRDTVTSFAVETAFAVT